MIAPSAVEVAGTTGFPRCRTDILSYLGQIELRIRLDGRKYLFIGAGRIVARETINIFRFGKVVAAVLPAVPCMANGATNLVAAYAYSEIVHDVLFADLYFLALYVLFLGPFPVRRLHESSGLLVVALQAFRRNFLTAFESLGDELGVIHLGKGCRCEDCTQNGSHRNNPTFHNMSSIPF